MAVLTPIAVDHAKYLGETPAAIALEKVGIIKPGATVVSAVQSEEVSQIVIERCAEVGATLAREGLEFGVTSRVPAVGGQVISLQGLRGSYEEVFIPLYGAHQAQNAALALAAVEAFLGGEDALDAEVVNEAFAEVTSPGRLEIIRRSPTIVLDAAHNPHGAAAVVAALEDSFTFSPLIGVIGVMADKDYEGLLSEFEPALAHVVCTQNSTDRSMPASELAEVARGIFGQDRVSETTSLADAIDQAAALAEAGGVFGEAIGSGRRARHRLGGHGRRGRAMLRSRRENSLMQRRLCAAILLLEAIAFGLSTPVLISVTDVGDRHGAVGRARPHRRVPARVRAAPVPLGLLAGLGDPGRGDRGRLRGRRRCSSSARSSWRSGPRRTSWAARSRPSARVGGPGTTPASARAGRLRRGSGQPALDLVEHHVQRGVALLRPVVEERGPSHVQHGETVDGRPAEHLGALAALGSRPHPRPRQLVERPAPSRS